MLARDMFDKRIAEGRRSVHCTSFLYPMLPKHGIVLHGRGHRGGPVLIKYLTCCVVPI